MSHCHDEHAGGGGGGGHHHHEHDHHSDDITPAIQHSLYQHINFDAIHTMNEATPGSGRAVVKKTWAERLQVEPELASDADEQIIVNVPFTGQVKLHSILLRSSASASAPRTLKVFLNREDVDFEAAAELAPAQALELARTSEVQELPVRRALFGRVQRLTLFFADNFGSSGSHGSEEGEEEEEVEATRLSYLGFRGEWMQLGRAPVNILYEAAPNPSDHALKGTGVNRVGSGIGGRGGSGV